MTSTLDAFFSELSALFRLPPRLKVSQWAAEHRELSGESSAKKGPFTAFPFQIEPMDAVLDPQVQETVLVWASQAGGKTEILNNIVGFFIHQDPSPMLMLQPTLEMAETWSKDRLTPMIRDTPVLRGLVKDARSRDSGNTILHKSFQGGHVTAVGANSAAGMAMRPIRVLLFDETDRYPLSAGTEGDPIGIAEKRSETFPDAVIVKTSTPTGLPVYDNEGRLISGSRILSEFDLTDKCYWFVDCVTCGHEQTLKWAQVKWPEGKPRETRYHCEQCDHPHTDEERRLIVRSGRWKATASFDGRRGYHLNGIYSLFPAKKTYADRLHFMAAEFLKARHKGKESLKTWTNTFLAEGWAEDVERVDPMPLLARRYPFGDTLPERCCFIVGGADVHPDRIEAQIIGFGEGEEAWPLEYAIFQGKTSELTAGGPWAALDAFFTQRFEHPCGAMLGVERVCVDTGHSTDQAYEFCSKRQLRGFFAVKGIQGVGAPVMNPPRKSGVKRVRLWLVATNTAKKTIYSRLGNTDPGPGCIHFRSDREPMFGVEYFRQLTAPEVIITRKLGTLIELFDSKGRRDEPLDTFVYALAALRVREVLYVKVLERMKAAATEARVVAESGKPAPKPPIKARRRSSFVSSWR